MRAAIRLIITIAAVLAAGAMYAEAIDNSSCLACHDQINAAKFSASIHGSMQCTDCHADVTAAPHENKPDKVNWGNCQNEVGGAGPGSLHATTPSGPKCLDCHGSPHEILPSTDSHSATYHNGDFPKKHPPRSPPPH